ncbi:hypothetical protein IGI37_002282 [Enterococcus sp. AZ194]|uniref:hypothetical protein n=1 Tax=Enterococcus sp. AZ194 TaxID=2774629 RepID=UPI003F27E9ED
MKLKPQNTYRHLLNFVGDGKTRPLLSAFHFREDGAIEATNAHILLRLLNHGIKGVSLNLHPKELTQIEGCYPETDKLFQKNNESALLLEPETCAKISAFLKAFKKDEEITISVKGTELSITNGATSALFSVINSEHKDTQMFVNCTYFGYVMSFIADCSSLPVQLCMPSQKFHPIIFKVDGYCEGIISQILQR